MPFEPGGLADKLGNRYEGRWVARQLLRLLNEEIRCVTVEAIGDDERGVDLWIEKTDGIRQAQQCKARNKSREFWSINDLKSRGIISHIKFLLDLNSQHEFALVSGIGATLFQDICNSARLSNANPEDFYKYQIQAVGEKRRQGFRQFCDSLSLNIEQKNDRAMAFDYLRRTYFILYPDNHDTWQNLLTETGYLLTGEPEMVVSTLLNYAENNDIFRKQIYADELRRHLATIGIHPKNLAYDQRIAPAIEELQRQFDESIRPGLIGGELIPREETAFLFDAFKEEKEVILHGTAGYGKSAVLYELTRQLRERDTPYLPIRLDRREPENRASKFGQDMGLPDSPVYSLAGMAGERQCLLILDQLDAIRWTCAHSANALDVCKELVRQVQSLRLSGKRISVVLCCRTFDLEHDPEIKNWLGDLSGRKFYKVEVKGLSMKNLEKIVGPSLNQMGDRQQQILACPQNLAMWIELKATGAIPVFRTATELMRRFWKNRRMIIEQTGITGEQMSNVLNALVDYMENHGKISAPDRIVNDWQNVTGALFSHGILQKSVDKITFCHQSYLDYLIADRVFSQIDDGTGNIIDWLGPKDRQSLFRREQLRQLLAMLCEESPGDFLASIKKLLESDKVRFHLKHLALELIGQLEEVNEELEDYCLTLLNKDYWRQHILETVCWGHAPYICLLIKKGVIPEWLNSDIEGDIGQALWLLRSVAEKIPDIIAELLESFIERDSDWSARVLNTICWNPANDSDRMFQLRLRLARLGTVSSFVEWKSLCSKHPLRALQLIEALVLTWDISPDDNARNDKLSAGKRSRLENWYEEDIKALNNVAENYASTTWDLFMPHIERLTGFEAKPYDPRMEKWQEDPLGPNRETQMAIERGIVDLVIIAGKKMVVEQPEELLKRTIILENNISPIVQEILVNVYTNLPANHADIGIRWLSADLTRLCLGSGLDEPKWMPAVKLVKSLSPYCSEELFKNLEEIIVHYHSPAERRLAEYYLKGWQDGYFGDYWGRAQYFLLPALDSKRVRSSTRSLIAVLNRKYASYPEGHFLDTGQISGGVIGSKLDSSLEKISDRAWLEIVNNRKIPERDNEWVQVDEDHAVTSTIREFSRSLATIAKRFPECFGQLSLRFPENVHPWYVSAILEAIGQGKPQSDISEEERAEWHPASVKTVEEVLGRFQASDDRETAISFCRLIRGRPEENWSDKTIKRLIHYAINHPDLEPGKLNIYRDKTADTADEASVDVLFDNTINCVRGVAAEAIGQLLWDHPELLEKLRPGIEHLVNDPHPAVRMASIDALLPVLNIDKDLAVVWFCKTCADDLRVAASPRAVSFFNYTVSSHFEKIAPLIRGMVCSPIEEVSQKGAKEVTARWLFYNMFREELDKCRKGTIPQRKGIAQVASHFLSDNKYAAQCQEILLPLLDDPEKDVRAETSKMFRGTILIKEPVNKEFLKSYVKSKAFHDHPSSLVYSLKELSGSLVPFAEIIFVLCEVFSTTLQERSREIGSDVPHTVSEVSSLLLRLYEQSQNTGNAEITNRCLDIWDMLFENRVGMIRELTSAIEKG